MKLEIKLRVALLNGFKGAILACAAMFIIYGLSFFTISLIEQLLLKWLAVAISIVLFLYTELAVFLYLIPRLGGYSSESIGRSSRLEKNIAAVSSTIFFLILFYILCIENNMLQLIRKLFIQLLNKI